MSQMEPIVALRLQVVIRVMSSVKPVVLNSPTEQKTFVAACGLVSC